MHCDLNVRLQFPGRSSWIRSLLAFVAALLLAASSFAQVDRSGMSGTVTDSSGRLLPQAHVTLVENATGLRRGADSDASGNYNIPPITSGHLYCHLRA